MAVEKRIFPNFSEFFFEKIKILVFSALTKVRALRRVLNTSRAMHLFIVLQLFIAITNLKIVVWKK